MPARSNGCRAAKCRFTSPLTSNKAAGRLCFTTDLKSAVAGTDAVFIAVGTPSRRGFHPTEGHVYVDINDWVTAPDAV